MSFLGAIGTAAAWVGNSMFEYGGDDGSQYCYEPFSFEGQCAASAGESSLSTLGRVVASVGLFAIGALGARIANGIHRYRHRFDPSRTYFRRLSIEADFISCCVDANLSRDRLDVAHTQVFEALQVAWRSIVFGRSEAAQSLREGEELARLDSILNRVFEEASNAVSALENEIPTTTGGQENDRQHALQRISQAQERAQSAMEGIMVHNCSLGGEYVSSMLLARRVIDYCEFILIPRGRDDTSVVFTDFERNLLRQGQYLFEFARMRSTAHRINRNSLAEAPLEVLRKFDREMIADASLSFQIEGEPAIDAGGVTREVFTLLFKALMEKEDGTFRNLLDLSEDVSAYRGLGKCLRYISKNQSVFLKEYFDPRLFRMIDSIRVDDLVVLEETTDEEEFYRIHEALKEALISLEIPGKQQYIRDLMELAIQEEELTLENFEQIYEYLEEVGIIEEDFEDLKETDPETYESRIRALVAKEFEPYTTEKFSQMVLQFRGVPQAVASGRMETLKLEAQEREDAGTCSIDSIQAPIDPVKLKEAITPGSTNSITAEQRASFLKKIELIKEWVEKTATPKQRTDFYYFITGSMGFSEGVDVKIVVGSKQQMEAHTCFNRLDIIPEFLERGNPANTTDAEIWADYIQNFEEEIASGVAVGFTTG